MNSCAASNQIENFISKLSAIKSDDFVEVEGSYRWAVEENIFNIKIDKTEIKTSWDRDVYAEIIVKVSAEYFEKLIDGKIDILYLLNTENLVVKGSATGLSPKARVQKIVNLALNGWIVNALSKSELAQLSVRGEDFQSCDRISVNECLTPYVETGCPVIIEKHASQWPISAFTLTDLHNNFGDQEVTIMIEEFNFSNNEPAKYTKMSLSNYLNDICDIKVSKKHYMAANPIPPMMEKLIFYPSIFDKSAFSVPRWWIGPPNTGLRLHRDLVDNFIVQIKGKKKIQLFSPSETEYLYPKSVGGNPFYEPSMLNLSNRDFSKFPNSQKAVSTEVTLTEGEMIYLPAGWWHEILNQEFSWSLNFFAVNQKPSVLNMNRGGTGNE